MLAGRAQECGRIEAVLAAAREGSSRSLALVGEPGVGKTALLDWAVGRARGMHVLRAAGTEFESELAFAALHQLLRPALPVLDELPRPQAQSLRAALGLDAGGEADRLGVHAAVLGLLAAVAEQQPVLCVVDDWQWIDGASAESLAFVVRRLQADRIAILLAVRDAEPSRPLPREVEMLPVEGLDVTAASELLTRADVADDVVGMLVAATHGNPLALLELPAVLTPQQRAGSEPLADPLPVSAAVEAAFVGHAASLPAHARRALVVAAAAGGLEAAAVFTALRRSGPGPEALVPAEEAGLVRVEAGAIEFRHPLVRSAVYSAASPAERRAAHGALADALEGAPGDRRSWHLAAASLAPAEPVAAELERVAEGARRRGGAVAAARAYQEAARLSPEREEQARRTVRAAEDWLRHGDVDRADDLLAKALSLTSSQQLRIDILERQGYLAFQRGGAAAAFERLTEAADAIEAEDPHRAAVAFSAASSLPLARLDAPELLRLATRVEALWGEGHTRQSPKPPIRAARARILAGETEAGARAMVELGELCLDLPATGAAAECAESLIWIDELELARALVQHELDGAHEAGDHLLVAFALNPLAQLELRSGRPVAAFSAATQAVASGEEIGQPLQLAYNLALLARAEAALGREADCGLHARRALALVEPGTHRDVEVDARAALGQLALGLGRPEEAIVELERVARILRDGRVLEPGFALPWAADLVEAYVHAGRRSDAERILEDFEERADAAGRISALALVARCRGLLAPGDRYDDWFEQALDLHGCLDSPFERFRTELCYAERLRRSKRRAEARERLRHALATLDQPAETPWVARARRELAAIGARVRRAEPSAADRLTPQELQVALAVAEGASNREVASRLFLSPKTIEFHLGNIYRKLGLRSRRELIVQLARGTRELEAAG